MRRTQNLLLLLVLLVALVAATAPSHAQMSGALSQALGVLEKQPAGQKEMALAAEATGEGHWTFANAKGERFTAGTPDEMKRVLPTLLPGAAKAEPRITLVVTEDTVFRQRAHFLALALGQDRRTDLLVAVDREGYPLLRRGDRLYAGIRPGLLVELTERRLFDETVWQLAHPLRHASIRVLALEPGGPASIAPSPRMDAQTQRPLTDFVAPASLVFALRTLRGQTVILTARREGETFMFRPSSGPDQSLAAADVLAAAEAADVNLVVLQSATPRQPGTRSWMWQRVSVTRLDDAVGRAHIADFLNSLATPQARLLVSASEERPGRIRLRAVPLAEDSSARSGLEAAWNTMSSSITGQVVISGVEASLRDRVRQVELDRRLLPGIHSLIQWSYLGLLALGLAGHAVASAWWSRIWPAEQREGYGSGLGFQAARVVRTCAYAVLFVPLVALASAPMALMQLLTGRAGVKAAAS